MPGHWIKKGTQEAHGLHALFFDTESYTCKREDNLNYQDYRLASITSIYYRKPGHIVKSDIKICLTKPELYNYVEQQIVRQDKLWIISANIWFDLRISELLQHLVQKEYIIRTCYCKGMAFIMELVKNDKHIICCNLQQFIPMSVKAIGELIGLPKLDINLETEDMNLLATYCQRDTEIVREMFIHYLDFIHREKLGKICYTFAGQALTAWRTKYMPRDIYSHQNPFISELETRGYYGGRVEIHYYGKVPCNKIYNLDINSMYPYIMRETQCPYQWFDTNSKPGLVKLQYFLHKYICMAEVAIDTKEPIYPYKYKGKLIFPTGRFVTWLMDAELRYANDHNHINAINYLVTYKKAYLFTEYVNELYKLRLAFKHNNNEIFVYLCKRLMNSLYGKFAQRIDNIVIEEQIDEIRWEINRIIDENGTKFYTEQILGKSRKVLEEKVNDGYYTLTAISSQITSASRIYLWQLIKQAGYENVYYTDTDSLYVNQSGYDNLQNKIDKDKLGSLKLEGVVNNLTLWGAKDYEKDGEIIIKGIRKNATQISQNVFQQIQFPGFRGDLRKGLDKPYAIKDITKELSRKYDKGIITPSGLVEPLFLQEF